MQSFRAPRATTNPYITQLDQALAQSPDLEHERFSWAGALFGRYDAFQWHWPEGKLEGTTWWKASGKYLLTCAIVLRHRLSRRIAVVRTVHNVELPDVNAPRRRLLEFIEKQADHCIVMNESTPVPAGKPSSLILHGHYRDWYAPQPRHERIGERLATFGAVRRYKSIDILLDAYASAIELQPTLSLEIGGRPSNEQTEREVRELAAPLPHVDLTLTFLTDTELVRLATSAELVVLAYRFMHNSGSVLAALSLDRPVLVPRNVVNEALADEVGADWVLMFDGDLDAGQLISAMSRASELAADARPDLSRRDWDKASQAHAQAFSEALAAKRQVSADRADTSP